MRLKGVITILGEKQSTRDPNRADSPGLTTKLDKWTDMPGAHPCHDPALPLALETWRFDLGFTAVLELMRGANRINAFSRHDGGPFRHPAQRKCLNCGCG